MRQLALDEIRGLQLELLKAFSEVAKSQELVWFLCAGTLLGSVRHQGYIPWDDDIDVMVPRPHYDRLVAAFVDDPALNGLSLSSLETQADYPFPYAKLWRPGTVLTEPYNPCPHYGVNIDIFPIDACPKTKIGRWGQVTSIRAARALLGAAVSQNWGRALWKESILRVSHALLPRSTARVAGRFIQRLSRASRYGATGHQGVQVWGTMERLADSHYAAQQPSPFEDASYPAPIGAEAVLTAIYGDYMRLPDEEHRVTHHRFTAFQTD